MLEVVGVVEGVDEASVDQHHYKEHLNQNLLGVLPLRLDLELRGTENGGLGRHADDSGVEGEGVVGGQVADCLVAARREVDG